MKKINPKYYIHLLISGPLIIVILDYFELSLLSWLWNFIWLGMVLIYTLNILKYQEPEY